jgi:hypothetical protein
MNDRETNSTKVPRKINKNSTPIQIEYRQVK